MPASAAEKPTKKRIRTPLFPQLETSECGAACLGILLALLRSLGVDGDPTPAACGVSRGRHQRSRYCAGSEEIRFRGLGLATGNQPVAGTWLCPQSSSGISTTSWYSKGVDTGRYYLNDPANGRRTVSQETLDRSFTGVVLTAKPGPKFSQSGSSPGVMRELLVWFRGVKSPLAFVVACGLLLALPGLFLPVLLSLFVDYVLGEAGRNWGAFIVAAAAVTGGLTYLLTWLQQHALRRLAVRLSVVHAERMLSRLFRLPIEFFAHRYAGDLTARVQLINEVTSGSSRHFVGIMIELVMSVLFLVLMTLFDPLLAAAIGILGVANLVLMRFLSRFRIDENRQLRREQTLLFGTGASILRDIDSLHATAGEDDSFARWSGYQARELVARQKFAELGYVIASLPRFFLVLGGVIVLGLGGWRVISGDMTIGMLMGILMW